VNRLDAVNDAASRGVEPVAEEEFELASIAARDGNAGRRDACGAM
jgi:hypothetical protein